MRMLKCMFAGLALLTALPASAGLIRFNDETESPTFTIQGALDVADGDYLLQLDPNVGEFVIGKATFAGAYTGVTALFGILDPGTTNISDILILLVGEGSVAGTNLSTSVNFAFISDLDTPTSSLNGLFNSFQLGTGIPAQIITETGSLQNIYCDPSCDPKDGSLVVGFVSDVDVPEPGSLALVGGGLLAAGARRRRRD